MINAISIDDEPLAHKVIKSFCDKSGFINIQKSFTQPNEALKHLRKFPAELLFVDIQMPGMTGINLVKALQQNSMIIFTTAFTEYAAVSYELNAIDYLLKPFSLKRFNQAINKAKDYLDFLQKKSNDADKSIFVRADFSLVRIPLSDIIYIEALADYLKIHVKDRKTVVTRIPMKEMLEKLPSGEFIRVHRSFILPFKKIESVRNKIISIADQHIPIGRTYQQEFYEKYSE